MPGVAHGNPARSAWTVGANQRAGRTQAGAAHRRQPPDPDRRPGARRRRRQEPPPTTRRRWRWPPTSSSSATARWKLSGRQGVFALRGFFGEPACARSRWPASARRSRSNTAAAGRAIAAPGWPCTNWTRDTVRHEPAVETGAVRHQRRQRGRLPAPPAAADQAARAGSGGAGRRRRRRQPRLLRDREQLDHRRHARAARATS